MKVGLFFGSFNPVHNGHLIIANHIVENGLVNEVWFVVSPQNPFKTKASLLAERDRLHLVNLGIGDDVRFKASDVEFTLPKPSFTAFTLANLREKFPEKEFSLLIGEDNLNHLHKWKNAESIIKHHPIICYPRNSDTVQDRSTDFLQKGKIINCDAPVISVSSSYIRKMLESGKLPKYVMPEKALAYTLEMNFYK